ncbi:thiosulfate transmembrane transporter [Aureococcus anophagefferens]|nr:thiosulfate transmembrane transporter [Aureococcus anophagefferens]
MAALAASSLPKSASHDDLAALSISKSASDGAMASPGLARAQSFASTPSLASLAGPPAPPLELEERDAASGLKYVLGVVLGVVIATLGALRATRFGDPPPWMPLREVLAAASPPAAAERSTRRGLQARPGALPEQLRGARGVFKGGGVRRQPGSGAPAAAGSAAQLATYDSVKGAALASELPAALAVPVAVCCSSVAYCTAAAPMDVVKARLMVARDGDRSGVLACVRDLARTGGPAAFFKGWLPAVLRLLPVALFVFPARPRAETFDAMEALRAFLGAAAY